MTDLQKADSQGMIAKQKLNKKKSITLKSIQTVQKFQKGTVLLADKSGSMSGDKMNGLKDALTTVWRPGIEGIAFDNSLYELTEEDIGFLHASGTTEMLGALKEAWSRSPKHIILMTDGIPDGGTQEILKELKYHTDVPIDTVGIGDLTGSRYISLSPPSGDPSTPSGPSDVGEPMRLTQTLQHLLTYTPDGLQEPQEGVINL